MLRAGVLVVAPLLCAGHFGILDPPTWTDPTAKYVHTNSWRDSGCGGVPRVPEDVEKKAEGCQTQWYTNHTFIPVGQEVTIPAEMRTWGRKGGCPQPRDGSGGASERACLEHPWAAPGTAPIFSPCGHDGGNPEGCPAGNSGKGGCAGGGYGHGPDARAWYQSRPRFVTEWTAGTEVEIKWGVLANHGGGYSFRLCPKPEKLTALTEECFQKGSLEFVGETSTAIYDLDKLNERTEFPASGISLPTGHWRQSPIPACGDPSGGASAAGGAGCTKPYQFPPRVNRSGSFFESNSLAGFLGVHQATSQAPLEKWAVIDKVKVPSELPAGDYVFSYRMDCEQTSQVWNMCADIKITAEGDVIV